MPWFDRARRDLPWRRTRDPYAVWISEIMLQQTRVETVIPYFERFLQAFPTVSALAAAPTEAVLTRWAGLGYYRRARMLHACARELEERWGGALPGTRAELLGLPGFGRYTAGAVASIGFGEQVGLVDGNVARVLARRFGLRDPVDAPGPRRRLEALADALVPAERPGDFNQALMELGATVCTPRAPRCEVCPLRAECDAAAAGDALALPVLRAKRPPKAVALIGALASEDGRLLLGRRAGELFGGMWEPPLVEGDRRGAAAGFAALGLALQGAPLGRCEHVLTHRVMAVTVHRARAVGPLAPAAPYAQLAWFAPDRLDEIPLSALARKVLSLAKPVPRRGGAR